MKVQEEKYIYRSIHVDEQWISSSHLSLIDSNFLCCMVCYGIPLDQYAECFQCGRIFCDNDYLKIMQTMDSCPNCKKKPFDKRPKPHILYKSIFDHITFECKLCATQNGHIQQNQVNIEEKLSQKMNVLSKLSDKNPKLYNKQQLSKHLSQFHQSKLIDSKELYDFEIQFEKKNDVVIFDMYQNIELNLKLRNFENTHKNIPKNQPYQLDSGAVVIIDFEKELVTIRNNFMKTGKLVKKPSKTLKKGIQYEIWQVYLDHDYRNYNQQSQQQIIKKYEQFVQNPKKNQFLIDIVGQKYRISFSKMIQTNTYTGFQRQIRRKTAKFN